MLSEMWRIFALVALAAGVMGCASTAGKSAEPTDAPAQTELEGRLRALIVDDLARAREAQGPGNGEIVLARPYYFKEYFEYPGEAEVFSLDFTNKESRTTPLTAELEVEKVRYATRMNTERDEARADENYLRSHGIDYVSYELRNGEWRRMGKLFLANSTEAKVDGEWKQIEEEKRPVALTDTESKGWFERLKFWK